MIALLASLGLFAFAWLLHLAWWRWRPPQRHTMALLVVFGGAPILAAALCLGLWGALPLLRSELPAVIVTYAGAAGCYLITYAGVEQTSPTLIIIRALEAAPDTGCSMEELAALTTEEQLIRPRLELLQRDRLLTAADRGFVLTRRGRRAALVALLLARIFNIREGA